MECLACGKVLLSFEHVCSFCQTDPHLCYQCQNPSCRHIQSLSPRCIRCDRILAGPLSGKRLEAGDGLYHVRELIGGGGMGEVYRSIEENRTGAFLREVAIKLNKEITTQERQDRFRREVQTLIKFNHPHNTRVYGYGEQRDNNVLIAQFMAMEFLHGITLDQRIEDHPLPLPDALIVYRQIARALSEAHQKGVIHRDLKPSNIKLINVPTDPPFAKLYDFGLSKDIQDKNSQALSSSGMIMGTLWYMSPEQARGESMDQRSDIFSMGVILYQMLTQQLPFPANNLFQLYQLHPHGCPPLSPELPPSIRELLIRSLAYDPNDRFSSLHECLALLPSIDPDRISSWLASGEFHQPPPSSFTAGQNFLPSSAPTTPLPPSQRESSPPAPPSLPSLDAKEHLPHPPVPWFSPNILWGLILFILGSSTIAAFFLWRANHHPQKPLGSLSNPNPPLRPTTRTPSRSAHNNTNSLPPNKRTQVPPPKTPSTASLTPPHPPVTRITTPPPRRKRHTPPRPVRRTPIRKKIWVTFKIQPLCETLSWLSKGQDTAIPKPHKLRMFPGKYTAVCSSPHQQFRRTFSFRIHSTTKPQIIQRTWKKITIKILFPRWGFPFVDGFPLVSTDKKPCQYGCFAQLWEGSNVLILRRRIQGTSRQATVHKQTLFLSPQLLHQPLAKRTFTIRWGTQKTPPPPTLPGN